MKIEKAAERLEALGSPTRLAVFRLLVRAGSEGRPVGEIQRALGIPASTLSHHLMRLLQVGLVVRERQARRLICRANYAAMEDLIGYLVDECCHDARPVPGQRRRRSHAA